MEKLCTLHELRTVYSISDLYDFHEALSLKAEAEHTARKEAEKK